MVLSLLLSLHPSGVVSQEDCAYRYLQEPPDESNCNPWSGSANFKVQCQASVPATPDISAEIHWFFEDVRIVMGSFPPLQNIEIGDTEENERKIVTSTILFRERGGHVGADHEYSGNYFCHILINGNYTDNRSRTLVLLSDGGYITLQPCNLESPPQYEPSTLCAGNPSIPIITPTPSTPDNNGAITTEPASELITSTTPTSDNSTENVTGDHATTFATSATTTLTGTEDTQGSPLQVWVYVLVAVAAVFGMIIVVLTILCVGLCLKKNKTEDTYKQKGADIQQFTSNSMVSNGLYQRKDDGGITSGTHNTSHSQISDYNALGERDYEVIDVGDDKHDYHHLQRPSPPMLPSGRNATFNFTPPKEFHSMSTLTSQLGGKVDTRGELFSHTPPVGGYLGKCLSEGPEDHVYHGLEPSHPSMPPSAVRPGKDIYRSPTSSDSPDVFGRGTMPTMDTTPTGFGYNTNESLYSPNFESSQSSGRNNVGVQQGGLENVPETGRMFSEPPNPTAFPVHNYEKICTTEYETPIATRKKANTITTAMATSSASPAPSSSLGRSRTNTGPRYETEVPNQQPTRGFKVEEEESQYSKLVRPSVDESFPAANTVYSELSLGTDEDLSVPTHLDKGLFPYSTTKQHRTVRRSESAKAETPDKSFSLPSHVDVPSSLSQGGVPSANPLAIADMKSSTDSLSSYIAHLQGNDSTSKLPNDTQIEEILFNTLGNNSLNVAEAVRVMQDSSSRRNGSLDAGSPSVSARGPQKRAWSEERGDVNLHNHRSVGAESGMMKNRCVGFSGSAMGGFLMNGQNRNHEVHASALQRDLRPNGLDPRAGEFARSRTMV